jgi:hypothetical protein
MNIKEIEPNNFYNYDNLGVVVIKDERWWIACDITKALGFSYSSLNQFKNIFSRIPLGATRKVKIPSRRTRGNPAFNVIRENELLKFLAETHTPSADALEKRIISNMNFVPIEGKELPENKESENTSENVSIHCDRCGRIIGTKDKAEDIKFHMHDHLGGVDARSLIDAMLANCGYEFVCEDCADLVCNSLNDAFDVFLPFLKEHRIMKRSDERWDRY